MPNISFNRTRRRRALSAELGWRWFARVGGGVGPVTLRSLGRIICFGDSNVPLFMVVEHFRNGQAAPVYRRFKERGRMAPEGLTYISSWVADNLATCYQLMETVDRTLLDQWMRNWSDLVEFEVHAVITSQEAAQRVAGLEA